MNTVNRSIHAVLGREDLKDGSNIIQTLLFFNTYASDLSLRFFYYLFLGKGEGSWGEESGSEERYVRSGLEGRGEGV